MTAPIIGSLFSGIGGIDYAFQAAGFEIVYQVEIDGYCQKVLKKHWPTVTRHRNIFAVDADTLPATDVITAGFPCQPFSVAGNQRGESDERFLWPEIVRVVTTKRPTILFLENVPGLRTIDSGNTFKRILRELAKIGYDAQWHHLRASDVGAPHRRERLFIVAYTSSAGSSGKRPDRTRTPQPRLECSGKTMGNAHKPASQTCESNGMGARKQTKRFTRSGRGKTQSRLGRTAHGLSSRLDRHQFPAPPGEQYDWEPARTTTQTENRAARVKGLGNAVCPQVVYPIAQAIREYLEQESE